MAGVERRLVAIERRLPTPRQSPGVPVVPNIIDFVVGDEFLARPLLYPRQATLLKVMFLAEDLLTPYDMAVIASWERDPDPDGSGLDGEFGVARGLVDRMARNREAGRGWFGEVVAVVGRRGSKGYIGACALAYVLHTFLATGDPQARYGLAGGKRLVLPVFAGTKDQAQGVFWQDLRNLIVAAPCFVPYLAEARADRLLLWSPRQLDGSGPGMELPTFEVVAREATESAGRGHAAFAQVFDEMAHPGGGGSNSPADALYMAARPALAQFGPDAFTYLASSPRHQGGQFYQSFVQGITLEDNGTARYPDVLSVQLPSWELYRDWEQASTILRYPGGDTFHPITRAIMTQHDPELQRTRDTNPEVYRVEYEAGWASVTNPFLRPEMVERAFEPWNGAVLEMHDAREHPNLTYVAHLDLAATRDNAALVVARAEPGDDHGRPHFVIVSIRHWSPSDYPDRYIHQRDVEAEAEQVLLRFRPTQLTIDPWNGVGMSQNLASFAQRRGVRVSITLAPTNQTRNRVIANTFQTALYDGRVHIPEHPLARSELLSLIDRGHRVDHPTTGPTTTKDVADCLFETIAALADLTHNPGEHLARTAIRGQRWPHTAEDAAIADAFSNRGHRRDSSSPYRLLRGGRPLPPHR